MLRVIQELRPAWVVGENVAGIVSMALDQVLSDLESIGYTCQAFIIPACAVDAPHRRDRCAIVAYADQLLGNTRNWVQRADEQEVQLRDKKDCFASLWEIRSAGKRRTAHGVPSRVDRLKCLGNAVVPQQFYPVFRAIAEIEGEKKDRPVSGAVGQN